MTEAENGIFKFDDLPWPVKASIFGKFCSVQRQRMRAVSRSWRTIIGRCFGIHVVASNLNWEWMEENPEVRTALVVGLTRDILNPCHFVLNLKTLEFTDMTAYYSMFHLLEKCSNLQDLILRNISLLPSSKLPDFLNPAYFDGSDRKWLPRLTNFVFSTHTPLVIADEVEQMDIGRRRRDEGDFLPMIFQMIRHSPLKHLDLTLGDMWKVQFKELFGNLPGIIDRNGNPFPGGEGSLILKANWLPLKTLGKALDSLQSCRIYYPFRDDDFQMTFHPGKNNDDGIPQLKEVIVLQFFKWGSAAGETLDSMWLHILEHQSELLKLTYAFPITGTDARIAAILNRNKDTLESITFSGYRDVRDEQLNPIADREPRPWDASWFGPCHRLQELTFNPLSRVLFPLSFITLQNPHLLPKSLRSLKLIGTMNTGDRTLEEALKSLENLENLELKVRKYPWFMVQGHGYSVFDLSLFRRLVQLLPKLRSLKLVWSEDVIVSGLMEPFVLPGGEVASKTDVSGYFLTWLKSSVGIEVMELRVSASSFYWKDEGLEINILEGFKRTVPEPSEVISEV